MIYGYIYKIVNRINNKIYIGQKKGGFNKNYYGSGMFIKKAIAKHGKNNFSIEVIGFLPNKEQLDEFEKHMIAKYREIIGNKNMYNLSDGGEDATGNKFHKKGCLCNWCNKQAQVGDKNVSKRPDVRAKIKESWKHRSPMSEETKKKIGAITKGIKNPKHSEFMKGRTPWNKGIKLDYSVWNKGKKGQIPWNKGLTVKDERVAKYIKTRIENNLIAKEG